MNFTQLERGYVEDAHGFSRLFSWWRNAADYRTWSVCGHSQFCKSFSVAITNDFGDLVEVA